MSIFVRKVEFSEKFNKFQENVKIFATSQIFAIDNCIEIRKTKQIIYYMRSNNGT
jgi:hypothetical protein